MTREEAKKSAEVMMAYANGKEVEFLDLHGNWSSVVDPFFNWNMFEYRIKQRPTYRPFNSKEECWTEMQKHQPFGWTIVKELFRQVITISDNYVCLSGLKIYYNEAFEETKFADGTPFGIKEE